MRPTRGKLTVKILLDAQLFLNKRQCYLLANIIFAYKYINRQLRLKVIYFHLVFRN